MSSLILPRRFTSQPQGAVKLSLDSRAAVFPGGFQSTDGLRFAPNSSGIYERVDSLGQTVYSTGATANEWASVANTLITPGGEWSASALINPSSRAIDFAVITYGNGAVSPYYYFQIIVTTTGALKWQAYSSSNLTVTGSANDIPVGVYTPVTCTYKNGTVTLFANGKQVAQGSAPTNNRTDSNNTINLFKSTNTGSWPFSGSIANVVFENSVLSEPEIASRHANPWQIFRAPKRVLYFDVGGGATNIDSAAGSGSITVTGSAANALRAHLGVAASGSITLTGSAANGVHNTLTNVTSAADAGSISLIGSAANALRTHVTAAGVGSIAVTGSAATSLRTHLGVASSGSISITGSAANAVRTFLAAAESGAINVTGSSANGIYTPVGAINSDAAAGSISITGAAALGRHDYLAAAGSGSITVTGSAANAIKSLGAVADSGSIAITGSNALAIRTWLASADAGSITLTGSTANGVKDTPGTGTLDPATIAAIADAVWAHSSAVDFSDKMLICSRILRNRMVTDPVSGIMTIYDDDDITPYLTAQLHENVAETQTYRGQGAEVRARLT